MLIRATGGKLGVRAVRSKCDAEHIHDSRMEARVCMALRSELAGTGLVVFVHARLPVWCLGPQPSGRPDYVTIDFAVLRPGAVPAVVRLVDAKPRRRAATSRDWRRGRRALEATYGIRVEERAR